MLERTGERSSADSEDRYVALYENIPIMYFTLDRKGTVLSVNSHGAAELGYEPAELLGRSVLDVFHPDDRKAVQEQLGKSLTTPGRVASWEFRKVRKDGTILWVKEAVRTVESPDGSCEVLVACQDVTERKLYEQKIHEHEERLRSLTSALSLAEERERRRIALGLHDRIGGTLAAASAKIKALKRGGVESGIERSAEEIENLIGQAIHATRSLTFDLSSPILYELGLEAAIEDLGERMTARSDIRFSFESDGEAKPLTDDTRVVLFRTVREILVNVLKHAGAGRVQVAVERIEDRIRIGIADDGRGFVTDGNGSNGGFGLFSIREQLDGLGGRLEIDSSPGSGTRITVEAPLA